MPLRGVRSAPLSARTVPMSRYSYLYRRARRLGFSLIELLIVVVIIGIRETLLVPSLKEMIGKVYTCNR